MAEKARIKWQSLASRLSGFSAFGVIGLSWKPPPDDRETVHKVIVSLEDKRSLYVDFNLEVEEQVVSAVMDIRKELTGAIKDASKGSPADEALRIMRAVCTENSIRHRRRERTG